MRIDALSTIQNVYGTQPKRKTASVSQTSYGRDAVEISSIGKSFQIAKQAVKDADDIRQEKTAPLKEQVKAGTYDVSGESFAEKLMEKLGL
ncbi:MAG: flagellar biosynthesis anti-sigma factor FlgM [Lachnospiraceae bacterium]|nr:flagellar biosynthesis anti-sigma factor FlgM [Lachnospiraceae bacterium]